MSTTTMIVIVVVLALIAAIAVVQRARPRVTQIDRTIRRKKDRDDA